MLKKYKPYNIGNLNSISYLDHFDKEMLEDIKIVGDIYPFKTNNYVLDDLINWEAGLDDPMFRLNFPHRDMLSQEHFDKLKWGKLKYDPLEYNNLVNQIRLSLNPHPAGQSSFNVPFGDEGKLEGMQHKYSTTVLFFPSHSQTCHAYCTFCFRWPQFVSLTDLKFQAKEVEPLINYLNKNPFITDVLLTGGDPMIMNSKILRKYIEPILNVKSVKTIRIGTKALSFWPYKFVCEEDTSDILDLLELVVKKGKHLAIMAHFNHPIELKSEIVEQAIYNLRKIGAEIRTQAPLLKHINNSPEIWAEMWERQVQLGLLPYYMFLPRDTGAQHYFAEDLASASTIYMQAIQKVSGLGRTAKGPVMSVLNGKVELLGIANETYYLRYLQHRDSKMAYEIFEGKSLKQNPTWFTDLVKVKPKDGIYFDEQNILQEMSLTLV